MSKTNTLVLKNATFDTAGMYICAVTVPEIEGMKTSGTLRVTVSGESEYRNSSFNSTFSSFNGDHIQNLQLHRGCNFLLLLSAGPPKIIGLDFQDVETYETTVNLSCRFRGYPVPTIMWTTADGKV